MNGGGGGYPGAAAAVMGQFGGGQYCPADNLAAAGLGSHYSPGHGWYQTSAADPRFGSAYNSTTLWDGK